MNNTNNNIDFDDGTPNRSEKIISDFLRFFYSFAHYIAIPGILIRLLWRSRHTSGYRKRWNERFGYVNRVVDKEKSIWVHAVSVGEANAAIPLIKEIKKIYPHHAIVVTTTTPTGSAEIIKHLANDVIHVYTPYDIPSAVNRFLRRKRIRLCIIMETEIWPNMLRCCRNHNIPIVLANARLSERSYRSYRMVRWFIKSLLDSYTMVAAQGLLDGERLLLLGVNPARLMISGNIKFDINIPQPVIDKGIALRQSWSNQRPVLIAASTHEGEEAIILQAFKAIKKQLSNALLILVPRHPDRFNRVIKLCQHQGFRYVLRSLDQQPNDTTEILIGDTMGELLMLYAASDIAFVGGSLVETGGHNLIEPAALGLPILTGPHLHNFTEISKLLQKAGAASVIHDEKSLATTAIALFSTTELCSKMGIRAREVIEANRGALAKHLEWIKANFH